MKKAVLSGREANGIGTTSASGMRRELMRLPNSHQTDRSNQYTAAQDNDDFIQSESDRQMLLIKYSQFYLFPMSLSLWNGALIDLYMCLFLLKIGCV